MFPTTKKYINLNGLPNKKFSCMRCHWHRMHDFCVRKSIISGRIRSRIQKGFRSWISGLRGIVWWKKTEGRKSRDTVPLNVDYKKFVFHWLRNAEQLIIWNLRKVNGIHERKQDKNYETKRNFTFDETKRNETKRNFAVYFVSRNKRNFAKQFFCFALFRVSRNKKRMRNGNPSLMASIRPKGPMLWMSAVI
jgi:hypothetical protein